MTPLGRYLAIAGVCTIVVVMGFRFLAKDDAPLALQQVEDETCDSCTARHKGMMKAAQKKVSEEALSD
ncbi:hypothetical protein SAMN05444000_12722 [Shimia gijangensis]|uniref:Uncharacterized protein n=1 Tax=Shimia gijangensis TaxID=1470563 RepID=A0A1M6S1K8_9RHOB|nr:hypothetical protein [Shimia gijangensis]SHK38398.1 hypothetical protein SAMN05444000_12722 [Shimia gijangensis]